MSPRRSEPAHIALLDLQPRTAEADRPAKGAVGRPLSVAVTVVKDGHDVVVAALRWRPHGGDWAWEPMVEQANSRWQGSMIPTVAGHHEIQVVAWTDRFAGWRRDIVKRASAGQDLTVELEVGARLVEELAADLLPGERDRALAAAAGMRDVTCSEHVRLSAGLDDALVDVFADVVPGWDRTRSPKLAVWVDRERAAFSAWYELFPRSHGGLRGVIGELDRIAALGFDVLYLPPIHPIGRTHRKGKGNTLVAGPKDPGSPWAIGAAEGGHTAIHPDLGTDEDLAELVAAAADRDMEVALDYALQCAPDHPWVAEHPEWFNQLPDGSIRYAENPPKKYQDIYPINFWPDRESDRAALWQVCKDIIDHWVDRDVRIFRVDNPHTKPLAFWTWLIAEVQGAHPDVLFLAEAFTTPAMMARLGEVGFSQSYSYFTWRYSRVELTEYVTELTTAPLANQMRANFWPNTPDILEGMLRGGPLSAFALRFVLAATLLPNYGIYSGYELGENTPQSPDNTEYLNSEKYQVVERDYGAAPNLNGLITAVNRFRRAHPALQHQDGIRFHASDSEAFIVYSRAVFSGPAESSGPAGRRGDVVLCVVNLDPVVPQAATLSLDLEAMGFAADEALWAHDALSGQSFAWQGPNPWVRLDPGQGPAHLFHLQRR